MAMYREPRTSPIIPAYGELSLADLSASLLASLSEGPQPGGAVAGYLYFPKPSKKTKNASYEITYYGEPEKIRLLLPSPAGR